MIFQISTSTLSPDLVGKRLKTLSCGSIAFTWGCLVDPSWALGFRGLSPRLDPLVAIVWMVPVGVKLLAPQAFAKVGGASAYRKPT